MQSIRSYDAVHEIERELDQAAANGTLTEERLALALDQSDEAGFETIPYSIGMNWIRRNPQAFARAVEDPFAFICSHLDNYGIRGFLYYEELLKLVAEDRRAELVRAVLMRCTPSNNSWVESCLSVGVSREELAQMMLDKLCGCEVDTTAHVWNFLEHDFLRYGAGRVESNRLGGGLRFAEGNTLWSLLTDEQLYEAVSICADKAPSLLFSTGDINSRITLVRKLRLRLSEATVQQLLLEAAYNLKSLGGVSLDIFSQLPLVDRRLIAEKLDGGSLELVIRLALEMGGTQGREFCTKYAERFNDGSAVDNIRRLWAMLAAKYDVSSSEDVLTAEVALHVQRRLIQRLKNEGFIYAQAKMGSYFNRKAGRNLPQAQVEFNGLIYVQDRFQRRYNAKDGDWVIIDPKRGKQLTPKVVSVVFVPAHTYGEYA